MKQLLADSQRLVARDVFDPASAEVTYNISSNDYMQHALLVPFVEILSWTVECESKGPEQRPPELLSNGEPWSVWLYLAGRGAGKTRSGAEWVRYQVHKGCKHGGLISPTTQDIRKVLICVR